MTEAQDTRVERPLGHYRVLELPGVATLLAGKTFADLGADVIKVEPPGGDPARSLLHASMPGVSTPGSQDPASEQDSPGFLWAALDIGKRHVTADLTTEEGRALVLQLASEADVLVEGFMPGELQRLGLGPERLHEANPRLVVTSLSSFGQDGPYAQWRGSDLVHFAMNCYLHMTGPADGPPIKPSAPFQSQFHASMHAVGATLIALRQREQTGDGTHVDVAMRDVGMWMLTHTYQFYDWFGQNLRRLGSSRDMGGFRRLRTIFTCKDGHIVWLAATGHIGGASLHQLVAWMHSEGLAPEWLREIAWEEFDYLGQGPSRVDDIEVAFAAFFATKTKAQLLEWALAHRLMLAPLQTVADVIDDPQLAYRDAWRTARLPGADRPVKIPGPPVRMTGAVWEPRPETKDTPGVPAVWLKRDERVTPAPAPRRDLPLSGIRVIDFSTTLAGPCASRHLSDFGAEVIRVESSSHPDTIRTGTPYAGNQYGINRSGYFAAYNVGKKSLALNMNLLQSHNLVRRLLQQSDILLEAFVPGIMKRWRLAWEDVRELNPRLIMASHCLQGQTGPRASHRGYGHIASAMSGWYDLTGLEGQDAVGPYSAYTDFVSWPFLLTSLLVALETREQTGRGQYIDHAQLESSVHFLAPQLLDLQVNGRRAQRRGNHEDYAAPNNVYECMSDDTWLAITVTSDAEWAAVCGVFGHVEQAYDPRFATHAARKANESDLDALITSWTRRPGQEPVRLAHRLQAAGVAAGPVQRAQELFADPQLQHRHFFRRLQHAEMGEHAVHTQTFRIAGVEPGPFTSAPLLGEHTLEVCSDILGMSPDEIAEYAAAGVFE